MIFQLQQAAHRVRPLMNCLLVGLFAFGFSCNLNAFQAGGGGDFNSGQFRRAQKNQGQTKENQRPPTINQTQPSTPYRSSSYQDSGSGLSSSTPLQPRNDDFAIATGATVFPVAEVAVPARTSGPLNEVLVKDMQEITESELMAMIDMDFPKLQLESSKVKYEAALAKASDDVAVRYAQKAFEVAKKEMEMNMRLARRNAVPEQEARRSKLAAEQAQLQIEKSRHDLLVAKKEAQVEEYNVSAAEAHLTRHEIKAPLTGNVVEILKHRGEWVNEGEEVFRIIQLNKVNVEGMVDITNYSPSEVFGRPVTVTLTSGRKQEVFKGRVVMVDMEVNSSTRYRVRAEVENRRAGDNQWVLISGVVVDMQIDLKDPLASRPADDNNQYSPE